MSKFLSATRFTAQFVAVLLLGSVLGACQWVDSTGVQPRATSPSSRIFTLLEEVPAQIDLAGLVDTSVDSDDWILRDQGVLPACESLLDPELTAASLSDACADTAQSCELFILPSDELPNRLYTVLPPRLKFPLGLHYQRNGTEDITFCIEAVDELPTANPDRFRISQATELRVQDGSYNEDCGIDADDSGPVSVLANDSDDRHLNGPCLTAELLSPPLYAANDFSASFTPLGGFRYTPDSARLPALSQSANLLQDTFSYRVFDGQQYSPETRVTIELMPGSSRPVARFDRFEVKRNSRENPLQPLLNDESPYDLPLEIVDIPLQPNLGGKITVLPDQTLLYTPPRRHIGVEYFAYTVENSLGESASAYVEVRTGQ